MVLRTIKLWYLFYADNAADIARFMQPDPLATENHGVSPYIYCLGDPINFIDPTGEKVYYVDMTGRLISSEEAGTYNSLNMKEVEAQYEGLDVVLIIDKDGKILSKSDTFIEGTITARQQSYDNKTISMFTVNNNSIGNYLFEYLVNSTNVEWGHIQADNVFTRTRNINFIGTSSQETSCAANLYFIDELMSPATHNVYVIKHSHPEHDYPSGLEVGATRGDIPFARYYNSKYRMPVNLMIYHKPTGDLIYYNHKSTPEDFNLPLSGIGLSTLVVKLK